MNDFLEDYNDVQGTATTPAEDSLFNINHNASKLSDKDRQRFHTCTARLLYISKRINPDLLLAISLLASRVLAPNTQGESKLHRGKGSFYARSKKQGINTISSTD
jgi:hypothetical protein